LINARTPLHSTDDALSLTNMPRCKRSYTPDPTSARRHLTGQKPISAGFTSDAVESKRSEPFYGLPETRRDGYVDRFTARNGGLDEFFEPLVVALELITTTISPFGVSFELAQTTVRVGDLVLRIKHHAQNERRPIQTTSLSATVDLSKVIVGDSKLNRSLSHT
jgi:hypothetical protein